MTVPKTHTACVSDKVGDYPTLRTIPTPDPSSLKPGQALVHLQYSGVCHSDVALSLGHGTHRPIEPIISGHEGVGTVVALGPVVLRGTALAVGARVGVKFIADTCMCCAACLDGDDMNCEDVLISSINKEGTFQQYVTVAAHHLVPIPDGVLLEVAAPILCAGITTYKALLLANLRPGDWVAIPGTGGGLGHLAVQYALALNLRVCAIDTGEAKQRLMESYGVHAWIDYTNGDVVEQVKAKVGKRGVRAAIVTAGVIKPYQLAMEYLGARGTMVCLGLPSNGAIPVDPARMVTEGQRIIGSAVGNRRDAAEALNFVALGKVGVELEVRPMSEIAEIYKELEAGSVKGRVVIDMRS